MFILYLIIFIIMVSAPYIIYDGFWYFSEDDAEALVLLCAGVLSFVIYRLRDYQVFQTIRDRMRLQRLFARAQKELSESYSYIGQANRRTDIIYEIFSDLSHVSSNDYNSAVKRAMALLPYTEVFSFRFICLSTGECVDKVNGSKKFNSLPDHLFSQTTNTRTYRHKDILFVYSESKEKNLRACVALSVSDKAENDIEFLKALTAYFTMVYAFRHQSCANLLTPV